VWNERSDSSELTANNARGRANATLTKKQANGISDLTVSSFMGEVHCFFSEQLFDDEPENFAASRTVGASSNTHETMNAQGHAARQASFAAWV